MARLNSRRARAAKRQAAIVALAKSRNFTLQVETGKVRDSVVSKRHITDIISKVQAPRFSNEDVPGKRKPKIPHKPVAKDVVRHTDTLREHYLKAWKGGRPIKAD